MTMSEDIKQLKKEAKQNMQGGLVPAILAYDYITKAYQLGVMFERERVVKTIDENIAINQRTHRVGSHSDDYGGESDYPCDCDKEEKHYRTSGLKFLKYNLEETAKKKKPAKRPTVRVDEIPF